MRVWNIAAGKHRARNEPVSNIQHHYPEIIDLKDIQQFQRHQNDRNQQHVTDDLIPFAH